MTAPADGRMPSRPDGTEVFALAVALAALAGWVDATGFISFHGLFVSFMSGNSTQSAVAAGQHWTQTIAGVRAILVFVLGVMLGELAGAAAGIWIRPTVLALEAVVLWGAVIARGGGEPVVASLLGLAMGLQNASVHRAGGISVALTYVTGTLVHIGRGLAAALRGEAPWRALLPFLALWLGLVAGGLGGAAATRRSHGTAMIVAAVLATSLVGWSAMLVRRRAARPV